MLLTITNTTRPADDLGWLLHKRPDRVRSVDLAFGPAHVFYPEAGEDRCTAALLLEVDPVGLVRGRKPGGEGALDQYVNDRPYAASSFLSVAIAQVYGTALAGRCADRPELIDKPLALEVRMPALPCRGGEAMLARLFEPLGYAIRSTRAALDERFPDWGASPYLDVTLSAERPLAELLSHLYVLVPVLDDAKHYWVGSEEGEKLLRHGEGWLASHPERELIARRYLRHQRSLFGAAMERLAQGEDATPAQITPPKGDEETALERGIGLNEQRVGAVLSVLRSAGAHSVVDLGCGEGRLLRALVAETTFERIVGLDVSQRVLERAAERLHLDRMPEAQRRRVALLHGSLVYRDRRLSGFDAATVVEVIEHLDPARLAALERVLFELARPATVVVTTPHVEFNVHFPALAAGRFRHGDHRFEWTREEFRAWAAGIGERFGYAPRFLPVGPEHAATGAPTQMAVFTLASTGGGA